MDEVLSARQQSNAALKKDVQVYVATPYCLPTKPDRCGFCLFPSEDYQGPDQLRTYLDFLRREVELLRPYFSGEAPKSIYFGGGTANLYKPRQYATLVEIVQSLFPAYSASKDVEVTLEGIPQLFTRDKLMAAKDAGFNRVSMGVQQIDDDMIALSGRKQKAKHVFQTLEWCEELGFVTSVDLIFGWPGQTVERMVAAGVRHLTHYELNVAGRSDFARNHRDTLPSIEANLEMYRASKQFLSSQGYRQGTLYDWELPASTPTVVGSSPGKYFYEESLRETIQGDSENGFRVSEMLGLGFAGVTNLPSPLEYSGSVHMNHTNVDDYFNALREDRFPVERGYRFDPKDVELLWIFQRLQSLRIDRTDYTNIFGGDIVDHHSETWQALEERNWLDIQPDAIQLVGDGEFFAPTVQRLISKRRSDELRKSMNGAAGLAEKGARRSRYRRPRKESGLVQISRRDTEKAV